MKTMMSKVKIVAVALACLMLGVLFFVGGSGEVKAEESDYTFVTNDSNTEYAYVAVSGTDVSIGEVPNFTCVPDDYLFAGWFKTTACTSDDAVRTTTDVTAGNTYYAKYVQEDVLSIRAQVSTVAGTDENGDATRNIRFVSSVDSLAYSKVGFKLEYDNTTKYNNSTTVFERIESKTTGDEFTFSPKIIDTDSEYFITATWTDVLESDTTGFYVRAYIKTLDGVVVYGPSRYVTVPDGLSTNQVVVPMKGEVATDAAVTYNDGTATRTATAVEVINNANKDTDDSYTHVRITLAGTKADLDSVTTFEVTGTNLTSKYRYPYTTYTGSGTEDTTWYNSTDDEFIIATSADLYGLANKSSQFTASDKIYVVSDIKINTGKATAWGTTGASLAWTPISAFAGKFDGQGHTISGLYGKSTTHMGLFTTTANTTEITNLKITNSYFETSGSGVGLAAIAGNGHGTFKDIYADAILVGTASGGNDGNVGGILGQASSSTGTVTIENCWSNCTIQAAGRRVGGILGAGNSDKVTVKITHCLNTGTITDTTGGYRFFGGLIGATGGATDVEGISTFTMDDCLNMGTVTWSVSKNNMQGAILGEIGGTADITNTYYLEGVCTNPEKVWGNGSSTGTVEISSKTATELAGDNAKSTNLDFDNYWSVVDGAVPELKTFAGTLWTDTTWFDTSTKGGIIMTKSQLYGFASLVAGSKFDSNSKVYLGADITVNQGTASNWGTTAPEYEWTPINAFAGKFDGQGHTISGLYGKSNTHMGLFKATADTTVIENLKVTNSYFETSGTGVGLAAISGNGHGTFKDIYADAILVGTASGGNDGNVGGILGQASSSTGTVTIENCWSNCTIQAAGRRVGGILGAGNSDKVTVRITHCLNTGTITDTTGGYRFFGGLIGATGSATDVDEISTFTMDDCLNMGTVTWSVSKNNMQGAILGEIGGTADITNTYYLEGVCTNPEKVWGNGSSTGTVEISSKTATELAGDEAKTYTNLDWNYWSVVYGAAPVLTTFAKDLDVLCVDTSWYDTTTKGGTIETRSHLYGFISLAASGKFDSDSKVYLGEDITVNEGTAADWGTTAPKHEWTPISAFAGAFDGQGHTISGLYGKSTGYMGLFQNTQNTTKITNLKVTNSYFETSGSGLSAISSYGRGTFSNIYADATLVEAGDGNGAGVAGIVGISMPGTVKIENCWSNCTIKADGARVAGILGSARADVATVSIKHCLNTGTITYTGNYDVTYRYFGGIVGTTGTATDVDEISTFTMDDCLNVGTVTTSGGTNTAQGAIIGQVAGTADITNTYALFGSSEYSIGNQAAGFTGTRDVHFKSAGLLEGDNAKENTYLDFVNYWSTVTGSTPVLQSFVREEYLSNIDKFTPSWNYDFPEEMMSYENKVAALNAVGEDARMISVFHKGDIQNYPENSIEALISAIQMGADVVEVDLVKTFDGHIVLMHDKTLSKYTDFTSKQGVNELPTVDDVTQWTLEQLRQLRLKNPDGTISGYVIPTLEEVLTVSNGRVKLVLDRIFEDSVEVLVWETEIYPIIAKTGAWDTWILPYQYDVETQIAIANKLKEGAGVDTLNIHAFVGFTASTYSTTTTNATTLKDNCITPIAYWETECVTDAELNGTLNQLALTALKNDIRIMGQNHGTNGIETNDRWDTLLDNGINMVLADKGFELQQYIATNFYTTNQ